MHAITEQLYAEKVAELSAVAQSQQAMIVALVWELGKGKTVTISKGNQRQADQHIAEVTAKRLSSGEIRFTVHPPEEGKQ